MRLFRSRLSSHSSRGTPLIRSSLASVDARSNTSQPVSPPWFPACLLLFTTSICTFADKSANMPSLVDQNTDRAERQGFSTEHAVEAFSSPSTRKLVTAEEVAVPASSRVKVLLWVRRRRPALSPIQIPDGSCLTALAIPPVPSSPDRASFPWPRDASLIRLPKMLSASERPVPPLKDCNRVALTLNQRAFQRLFHSTSSRLFWTLTFSLAGRILAGFLEFLGLRPHFDALNLGGDKS